MESVDIFCYSLIWKSTEDTTLNLKASALFAPPLLGAKVIAFQAVPHNYYYAMQCLMYTSCWLSVNVRPHFSSVGGVKCQSFLSTVVKGKVCFCF